MAQTNVLYDLDYVNDLKPQIQSIWNRGDWEFSLTPEECAQLDYGLRLVTIKLQRIAWGEGVNYRTAESQATITLATRLRNAANNGLWTVALAIARQIIPVKTH